MTTKRLPTYFISHGGGPWPWLSPQSRPVNFELLGDALAAIPTEVGAKPRAVLIVSAHWEEPEFTVSTSPSPPMVYDYAGFPQHTYEIEYPAPGDSALSERVVELATRSGILIRTDDSKGFDHGVFVPMYKIFPDADVPVVQLSLRAGLDPAEHLAMGQALAPLRSENILVIGSGVPSYHNMRLFDVEAESKAFDEWLTETMVEVSPAIRNERLTNWEQAPFSRTNHPREEHFLPGLIIAGAAGADTGVRHYHEEGILGFISSSGYRFDAALTQ